MSPTRRSRPTGRVIEKAVDNYVANHRSSLTAQRRHYRGRRSLAEAIDLAARAVMPDGRKHPHQWRLETTKLRELSRRLLGVEGLLRQAGDFEQIRAVVSDTAAEVWVNAELAVYDTALRIAWYRGLRPEAVYLHRGTRAGAGVLGFDERRKTIGKSEFPASLRRLSPDEIEDYLCIFKGFLAGEVTAPHNVCACGSGGGCRSEASPAEREQQRGTPP